MQIPADKVAAIKAPLMLHYAGLDERMNAGIGAYKAALDAAGKTYELHMYDGANHAFNNDTNTARYDKAAADLAWKRTVDFLNKNLSRTSGQRQLQPGQEPVERSVLEAPDAFRRAASSRSFSGFSDWKTSSRLVVDTVSAPRPISQSARG